jgi:hypothetical protein
MPARAKFARACFRPAISPILKAERDPQSKIQNGIFMAKSIEINNGRGSVIGSFTFDESPVHLQASRTASGFNLQLPFSISLASVVEGAPAPMVSDIRGVIFAGSPNQRVEIGRLFSDSSYTAPYRSRDSSQKDVAWQGYMTWLGSFVDLAFYNKLRDGGPVQFIVQPEWRLCYVFGIPMGESGHLVCTLPEWRRPSEYEVSVGYSRDVWVRMLRSLKVAENVLVEIPLPGCPSPEWEEVWKGLLDARNAFEQGGSTGWKGCVTGVRLALEKWRDIESEQMGPGSIKPKQSDLEARTKKERLDNLRWYLMQAAHLGPHTAADEWTRDDALLLLSTLSALLAERKP